MAEEKQTMDQEIENQEQVTEEQAEAAEGMDSQEEVGDDPTLQLKKELEEANNRYLRAQADFDNFRKRTRKEKEDLMKYASQPVIEALLPAVDNLERALAASKDSLNAESLVKGVEMVFRQIQQVLDQEGLKAIDSVGQPFDAHIHQAVMQEESAEHESGIILEEFQKGYLLKDRVIRPAMVKVSS